MNPEDVWTLFRVEFNSSKQILSVTPWGGDRAVIVTSAAACIAEFEPIVGFRIEKRTVR